MEVFTSERPWMANSEEVRHGSLLSKAEHFRAAMDPSRRFACEARVLAVRQARAQREANSEEE